MKKYNDQKRFKNTTSLGGSSSASDHYDYNHDSSARRIRSFPIKPTSQFYRSFPFFRQPSEIGHLSLDLTPGSGTQREVHCDARHLKIYCPPKDPNRTEFNLRHGYSDFIKRDDSVKERLNNITTWILRNRKVIAVPVQTSSDNEGQSESPPLFHRINADFVMWRGHMTKFLCTPYENREGWAMAVTLFRGTYYISEVETAENRARREGMTGKEKEMSYWGYKFEQYVTSGDEESQPDTSRPVDTNEAFCSVVRTRLENHSLLYSGEVDCRMRGSKAGSPGSYIELKTSRVWYSQNNERNFYRFKLIKMWAQSFLVGIQEVICGFRDDEGIVTHLRSFRTLDMPNLSRGTWDGAVCFNFANQLLSYIKEVVKIDDPKVVYMLERAPGSPDVSCTLHPEGKEKFLSDEYISAFR